jgi:serine phosphatase RsbU (regulator of sigma subunit)
MILALCWFLPVNGQDPDLESQYMDSAWKAVNAGRLDQAARHFEGAATATNFKNYRVNYEAAKAYGQSGNNAKALLFLDRAIASGFDDVEVFMHHPHFATLRASPEWDRLTLRISDNYRQKVRIYYWGFFYGILFLLLVVNTILFFSTREFTYVFYALLILVDLHFEMFWVRHLTHYFGEVFRWMKGSGLERMPVIILGYAYILSYLLFFRSFSQLKFPMPRAHRFTTWLIPAGVVLCLYDYFLKPDTELIIFYLLIVFVSTFIIALMAWSKGLRHVRLYVIASTAVTVSVVLMVLDNFDVFPTDIRIGVFNVFNFGMLSFYVILTFAIGDKMKLMRREKEKAQEKALEVLEEKVQERTAEVVEQKHLVEAKQKEILDSIQYAKRLQEAILPPSGFINENLPENFVLYQPKDVVAGDFYWAERQNGRFFIAAADSTGHGVPGAMVSVVCSNALNRAVKEFRLTETGPILDKTRELVLETFAKSVSEVKDGMDISLMCIDETSRKITWSGANNPLWYFEEGELKEIKADKQPVGLSDHAGPFATHQVDCRPGTVIYLFTDGLADQFGGPQGKKFKYRQFEELLSEIHMRPMKEQMEKILQKFMTWKGTLEQVDDVCVIGLKT